MSNHSEKQSQVDHERLAENWFKAITIFIAAFGLVVAVAGINETKLSSQSTNKVIEALEKIESNTRNPAIQPAPSPITPARTY